MTAPTPADCHREALHLMSDEDLDAEDRRLTKQLGKATCGFSVEERLGLLLIERRTRRSAQPSSQAL